MFMLHPIVKQVVCVVVVALLDQGIKEVTRIAAQRYAGGGANATAAPPPNGGGTPPPVQEDYGEEYPPQGC